MKKRRVKVLVALLLAGYGVSYVVLSRVGREDVPEELLPGGYTIFRFPGTMDLSSAPGQLPVNRLKEVDDALRIFYYPLIKLDRWIFKNVHHREVSVEMAHGQGGECLGYPSRYVLD
jgi:hypothetical protein